MEYFLTDAEPTVLICAPRTEVELNDICRSHKIAIMTIGDTQDGSLIEAARQASGACAAVDRDVDHLTAILNTSGTTGRSKGAMLSHTNLLSNTDSLLKAWRLTRYTFARLAHLSCLWLICSGTSITTSAKKNDFFAKILCGFCDR